MPFVPISELIYHAQEDKNLIWRTNSNLSEVSMCAFMHATSIDSKYQNCCRMIMGNCLNRTLILQNALLRKFSKYQAVQASIALVLHIRKLSYGLQVHQALSFSQIPLPDICAQACQQLNTKHKHFWTRNGLPLEV